MRYGQLRLLLTRLNQTTGANLRRYQVELTAKLTLPLMNLVMALVAFAGSTQPQLRGHLRGLGVSLVWGLAYYLAVGLGEGIGKRGLGGVPAAAAVWLPHVLAIAWCLRVLRRST
jgi:lipopolysaccharide export LptBFGC system permease protein LptF